MGPWRDRRSAAEEDLLRMRRGYREGGTQGLMAAKNELYRAAARNRPEPRRDCERQNDEEGRVDVAAFRNERAHANKVLARSFHVDGGPPSTTPSTAQRDGPDPFNVEGPNKLEHYRVQCKFKKENDWRGDASKPCNTTGPWRASREEAEEDGWSFVAAYDEGGLAAVRERKNRMHAPRPAVRVTSTGSGVDVETTQKDGTALYRAACEFHRQVAEEEARSFNRNSVTQSMLGPWRTRREDAEADAKSLAEEFDRGGIEAAMARKNELRRVVLAETPTERHVVIPSGELGQEQLGERYGPGLALMRKMGYTVGAGLGASGQGLALPINALEGGARRSPYDREGLGEGVGGSLAAAANAAELPSGLLSPAQ